MVPLMKLPKLCMANLSRAIIAAFAAQVVAGAMCLMPASAMAAMQASSGASVMPACVMHQGTAQSHAKHACPHCDAPVQAVSQIDITHGMQPPALVPIVLSVLPQPVVPPAHKGTMPVPRILAPPGSASLIFRTSQRIRI